MPDFKSLMDKARQLMGQHPDQVDKAVKTAGDQVDERTGNRHSEQVQKGEQLAGEHLSGSQSQQGQGQQGQSQQGQGQDQAQPGQGQPGGGS